MKGPDTWQRLKDIFNQLSDATPAERGAILERLAREENALYNEVLSLLEADEASSSFLDKPALAQETPSLIGERIGHFRITREVGRGGMGAVFEGVREDGEFQQKAAIKLSNRSLFSDELIRRFLQERQILATLDHPNIVRLLDGGVTAGHVPFFVMEFVDGTPVTDYAAANKLSTNERLGLFLEMCDAVSYAHRQLVVHRDLKPSNILVTAQGQVKLLDFGIAKVLDADSATMTAAVPLTPEYASPEQMSGGRISTSSDIYSLGMVLYELLTGMDPCSIYGVERSELFTAVATAEPPRPSTAMNRSISRGARAKDTIPDAERTLKQLRGDLDNIILKALQKDPERRYSSVENFADDIRAFLNGRSVSAHPQSFGYRAAKFIGRNRLTVSIAAASVLLIVAAAIVAMWQAAAARSERAIAERNFNQVRKIANAVILDYHDEIAKLPGSTALRERLVTDAVSYLDAISAENTDDPQLLKEMAVAYRKVGSVQAMPYAANLGKVSDGIESETKSVRLLEKAMLLAPGDVSIKDELVLSYMDIAQIVNRAGQNAGAIYERAIQVSDEAISIDGTDIGRRMNSYRVRVLAIDISADDDLTRVSNYQKILVDAKALLDANPDDDRLLGMVSSIDTRSANSMRWRGLRLRNDNKPDEAAAAFQSALAYSEDGLSRDLRQQQLAPTNTALRRNVFNAEINIAAALTYLGRLDEAEKHQRTAAEISDAIRKSDPENSEAELDWFSIIKNRVEIAAARGKKNEVLRIAQGGVEETSRYQQQHPDTYDGFVWTGYFYNQELIVYRSRGDQSRAAACQRVLDQIRTAYTTRFGHDIEFSGLALG